MTQHFLLASYQARLAKSRRPKSNWNSLTLWQEGTVDRRYRQSKSVQHSAGGEASEGRLVMECAVGCLCMTYQMLSACLMRCCV